MPEFYYEANDEQPAYRIDEISQQLLVYLSSYGPTSLRQIVDGVGAGIEVEIQTRIRQRLGPEAANFITQSTYTQQTFDGSEERIQYELTEEGEKFVRNNEATLSMPADFEELANRMAELRTELTETIDSMHRIDAEELNEQLTDINDQLEDLQNRLTKYE